MPDLKHWRPDRALRTLVMALSKMPERTRKEQLFRISVLLKPNRVADWLNSAAQKQRTLDSFRIRAASADEWQPKLTIRSTSEPELTTLNQGSRIKVIRYSDPMLNSRSEVVDTPLDLDNNPFLVADNLRLRRTSSSSTDNLHRKVSFKAIAQRVLNALRLNPTNYLTSPLDQHVLIGLEKVAGYSNQGIPKDYLEKMQQVANETNTLFAIRPVEKIYRTLIEEGYASKGLKIKGKSANWGPMAGFVPVDQHFSKISGNSAQEAKYNRLNQQILNNGYVTSEPLCISTRRFSELTSLGILQNKIEITPFADYLAGSSFTACPANGESEVFEAFLRPDGQWAIFSGSGVERKPLDVLPVIADFDLLFVLSRYESVDLGQQDRVKPFDEEQGFVSGRKKNIINTLNKALDRGKGKNMVHHGADTHNPVSEMAINLPATVMIPASMINKMGIYSASPVLLRTEQELVRFYRTIRDSGIHIEANPLWASLQKVAREPVDEKINKFGGRSH